jgi:hypothetical protein
MIQFTREGVQVDTFNEIFDRIAEGMKVAYGNDITVEQDSPDGQSIGISAKGDLDLQSFLLTLYSNLDPDFATGAMQDVILKFSGLTKRPASKSTVDLTVTSDKTLTLTTGYKRKDTLGQEWETASDYPIVSGANTVSFVAVEWGSVAAEVGTITEPSTIVLGIVSTTNPAAALVGNNEETEAQVRLRRKKSLENPAYSTIGAVTSKLIGLDGVIDVAPYENKTDIQDTEKDITPNTIWLIVNGGDVAEIIKNIAIQKTTGCATKGAIAGTWTETLQRQNGTTRDYIHTMNFDRPTDVPVYVRANAKRRVTGEDVDTDAIASNIATRVFYIADYLQAAELYQQGYLAGNNYILSDMEISLDDITYTDAELFSGWGGLFSLEFANIAITEVL